MSKLLGILIVLSALSVEIFADSPYDLLRKEDIKNADICLKVLSDFSEQVKFCALFGGKKIDSLEKEKREQGLEQIANCEMILLLLQQLQSHAIADKLDFEKQVSALKSLNMLREKLLEPSQLGSGNVLLLNAASQLRLALIFSILGSKDVFSAAEAKTLQPLLLHFEFPTNNQIVDIVSEEYGHDLKVDEESLTAIIVGVMMLDDEFWGARQNKQDQPPLLIAELFMSPRRMKLRYSDRIKHCDSMLLSHSLLNTKQADTLCQITLSLTDKIGGQKPRTPQAARKQLLEPLDELGKNVILKEAVSRPDITRRLTETMSYVKTSIEARGKDQLSVLGKSLR